MPQIVQRAQATAFATDHSQVKYTSMKTHTTGKVMRTSIRSRNHKYINSSRYYRTGYSSHVCLASAVPISPAGSLQEVCVNDFHNEVVVASKHQLVVVDCYTTWCGPCKMILPKLEELQAFFDDNHTNDNNDINGGDTRAVKIVKFNCNEENKAIAKDKLDIRAAPTFKFFKDGDVVDTIIGAKVDPLKTKILKYLEEGSE